MCFESKGSPHRLPFILVLPTNATGNLCAICECQVEEANLHPAFTSSQVWSGLPKWCNVDSQHSRRIPIIQLKNRPTSTLFTSRQTGWGGCHAPVPR